MGFEYYVLYESIKNTMSSSVELQHPSKDDPIRFLIVGAGSRGHAYATALSRIEYAQVAAIAEPIDSKRRSFGRDFIWGDGEPSEGQDSFDTWQAFVSSHPQPGYFDAAFVCTLDESHVEVITALAPLGLHIMSEKPLATTWSDCLKIYRALQPPGSDHPTQIFSIGHVLRYSPHNILLRKLLLEEKAIGDILSIEHTEPVGWWHFAHSYVRGNWRKESSTAPSLLTKSCHYIDLLLWLLCSPPDPTANEQPHSPHTVTSTGSLLQFKRSRKPLLAGSATNCHTCAAEPECIYSSRNIYENSLKRGNAGWPINIVDPEIEDIYKRGSMQERDAAILKLRQKLQEDYHAATPQEVIDARPWFGRCVYESANDVCDDQFVTITWDERDGHFAKQATFHMVASTEAQCERRGRVYGTLGEVQYDSTTIRVFDFKTRIAKEYHPPRAGGGHGGGDFGLTRAFTEAIRAVKQGSESVNEAQKSKIGCTLEEAVRSHGMVFAAEEARLEGRTLNWNDWWDRNVHGGR